VERGPIAGREFRFKEHDTLIFGRDPSCHASLPNDSFVSRHHFILEANPPQACIRDLGSLNGTRVNGVRYGGSSAEQEPGEQVRPAYETATLKDGDRIQVGETVFVVLVEGSARSLFCQRCGKKMELPVAGRSGAEFLCEACRDTVEAASAVPLDSETGAVTSVRDADWPSIEGYTRVRKLGSGGMGSVYLARRERDGYQVAVKIMLSRTAVDEQRKRWFLREMNVLGTLNHPSIVGFLERGVIGNTFFFVMEFCEGGDVGRLVRNCRGQLRVNAAVSILMHSLRGLAHAHEAGVVHRDIKPRNLLLSGPRNRWRVKVGDFGLAKNFEKAGFSGMTTTGMTGGTCAFMPREQITDFKYVQPASDVWSMAATFYFMLTGCPPRESLSGQNPLNVVLNGKIVPIDERLPEVPPQLATVLGKALADEPSQRFQTARAFRDALKDALPKR
jgi:eukaryotic-like serine/threonine-protein kinase